MTLQPRSALVLAGACGLLLALFIIQRRPPQENRFLPPCLFHKTTGLHCPGCGSTRALHAVLNLRLGEALRKNALLVLALPFLAVWAGRSAWRWSRHRPLEEPRLLQRPWAAALLVAVIVAFGILRNLPWPPFTLLAPH